METVRIHDGLDFVRIALHLDKVKITDLTLLRLVSFPCNCKLTSLNFVKISVDMGVGRIVTREGPLGDLSEFFSRGAKSGEIYFFPLKTKKTTFFAKNFKIQGFKSPFRRPCLWNVTDKMLYL